MPIKWINKRPSLDDVVKHLEKGNKLLEKGVKEIQIARRLLNLRD
jgi:exonuclease VII small subunit